MHCFVLLLSLHSNYCQSDQTQKMWKRRIWVGFFSFIKFAGSKYNKILNFLLFDSLVKFWLCMAKKEWIEITITPLYLSLQDILSLWTTKIALYFRKLQETKAEMKTWTIPWYLVCVILVLFWISKISWFFLNFFYMQHLFKIQTVMALHDSFYFL